MEPGMRRAMGETTWGEGFWTKSKGQQTKTLLYIRGLHMNLVASR